MNELEKRLILLSN